ncbi:Trp biosynthesis-associated membrane protein [Solwaraspora sp. WMMD791]|uniref:Trp biosynthesis-associated membrane protein n=1 Tax=Solwaraspora sp. WMMD791 TaxID=3016086 RepID=UPI00249BF561|nr:Trp biosynthesis-associated membrane protein [Solwaraspora sp. WMMD791]WFE30523.1 Trp biosynthesis-associated membrane protein [Solwaraspora sp. WMMD791]
MAGAVGACLVGAGLTWYAARQAWGVEVTVRPEPLPAVEVVRTGADVLPWLPALALVGLAGAGAVLASRGLVRRLIGALLAVVGVAVLAGAAAVLVGVTPVGRAAAETASTAPHWPALAMAGALLSTAGGLVTVLRSGGWPAMGARYERTAPGTTAPGATSTRPAADRRATSAPRSTLDTWAALDRGEDPTVDDGPR